MGQNCSVLTKCQNGTKLFSFDIYFVKTGQNCSVLTKCQNGTKLQQRAAQ